MAATRNQRPWQLLSLSHSPTAVGRTLSDSGSTWFFPLVSAHCYFSHLTFSVVMLSVLLGALGLSLCLLSSIVPDKRTSPSIPKLQMFRIEKLLAQADQWMSSLWIIHSLLSNQLKPSGRGGVTWYKLNFRDLHLHMWNCFQKRRIWRGKNLWKLFITLHSKALFFI